MLALPHFPRFIGAEEGTWELPAERYDKPGKPEEQPAEFSC